jgi:hypothetical protein
MHPPNKCSMSCVISLHVPLKNGDIVIPKENKKKKGIPRSMTQKKRNKKKRGSHIHKENKIRRERHHVAEPT